MASWAGRVFDAFACGDLSAMEMWTLVLDCYDHPQPASLLNRVLAHFTDVIAEADSPGEFVVLDEAG